MQTNGIDLDEFTLAYIECALWSSNDESDDRGGDPLDCNYSIDDIHPDSLVSMAADCKAFQAAHWDDIADDLDRAGHDFWLTRNGHGAGFWDGDWPEPAATRLTIASESYGTCDLFIGDDGRIYAS